MFCCVAMVPVLQRQLQNVLNMLHGMRYAMPLNQEPVCVNFFIRDKNYEYSLVL
jgi:hypothetical protein